jgi:Ser/Thr protein kinase RdoA (MazF antagonist)
LELTSLQLRKLLSNYNLQGQDFEPIKQGYLTATNKGRKLVTIWDNADTLRWSNGWREQLANTGDMLTGKFHYNRNKKKYIRYQGKYFVLSDAPRGSVPKGGSLDECQQIGAVLARLHDVIAHVKSPAGHQPSSLVDALNLAAGLVEIERIREKFMAKESLTLADELLYVNLPSLYQRMSRAHQLWDQVKDAVQAFPLSFPDFSLDQLVKTDQSWFVLGGAHDSLSFLHQDTALLVKDLFQKSGWSIAAITAFLDGYEANRPLAKEELVYVLIHMVIPNEIWKFYNIYSQEDYLSEEKLEELVQALEVQEKYDSLAIQLGRRLDALSAA